MTGIKPEDLLHEDLVTAVRVTLGQVGVVYREHRFHDDRKWRFDIAIPKTRLAIEVDGRGRHHTLQGHRADCEKRNAAVELGWTVLTYPASSVRAKSRRELIVDQVIRLMCRVECPESAGRVLTG